MSNLIQCHEKYFITGSSHKKNRIEIFTGALSGMYHLNMIKLKVYLKKKPTTFESQQKPVV